jgi:hypothetical protein
MLAQMCTLAMSWTWTTVSPGATDSMWLIWKSAAQRLVRRTAQYCGAQAQMVTVLFAGSETTQVPASPRRLPALLVRYSNTACAASAVPRAAHVALQVACERSKYVQLAPADQILGFSNLTGPNGAAGRLVEPAMQPTTVSAQHRDVQNEGSAHCIVSRRKHARLSTMAKIYRCFHPDSNRGPSPY